MSLVYLARHGETEYNQKYVFQGSSDVPLNEKGEDQARALLQDIVAQNLSIDLIISSPYKRALLTAQILASGLGKEITVCPNLRERSLGVLEGVPAREVPQRFPRFWEKHKHLSFYEYFSIPEGESLLELELRIFKVMEKILDEYQNLNILIVTHGFAARMIHKFFGGSVKNFHMQNCELRTYETEELLADQKKGA